MASFTRAVWLLFVFAGVVVVQGQRSLLPGGVLPGHPRSPVNLLAAGNLNLNRNYIGHPMHMNMGLHSRMDHPLLQHHALLQQLRDRDYKFNYGRHNHLNNPMLHNYRNYGTAPLSTKKRINRKKKLPTINPDTTIIIRSANITLDPASDFINELRQEILHRTTQPVQPRMQVMSETKPRMSTVITQSPYNYTPENNFNINNKNNVNYTPKPNVNFTPKNNFNFTPINNVNFTPKNNVNFTPKNNLNLFDSLRRSILPTTFPSVVHKNRQQYSFSKPESLEIHKDDRSIPRSYSKVDYFNTPQRIMTKFTMKDAVPPIIERSDKTPVYTPESRYSVFPKLSYNYNNLKPVYEKPFYFDPTSNRQSESRDIDTFHRPVEVITHNLSSPKVVVGKSMAVSLSVGSPFPSKSTVAFPVTAGHGQGRPITMPDNIRKVSQENKISFPLPSNLDHLSSAFNITLATGNGVCSLLNGQAMYRGDCSLLLAKSTCPRDHWLVLSLGGAAVCRLRRCPWGKLQYRGQCVDPIDEGVCGPGQMLYVNLSGETECDCEADHFYHSSSDTCYAKHEQGFCQPSFFIDHDEFEQLTCVPNPCNQAGLIKIEDRCFKKLYDGICPETQIRPLHEDGTAECMELIPHSIFGVGIQTSCPTGSKRSHFRRCRSVFRMPTQRTFPRQSGGCPGSFIGGSKNSCRRTVSLFG